MFSGSLEDRTCIRERYGAYSDAVFRQDRDAWLGCWSDAGVWNVFGQRIAGRAALQRQWDETWSAIDKMGFFAEVGSIEVDGANPTHARARSYTHEIVAFKEGKSMNVVGHYADELVKENGVWVFAERTYSVLMHA